jgi:DNA-binding response OmpR family regulator
MLGLFKLKKKTATVLVVDDEPDLVSTIKTRLEWHKFNVETASDGQQGLEKAARIKPDLILLDCNMPVMSGLEMLRQIRQDEKLRHTPVIMLTAVCDANDITAAGALDVTDYITKPFDFAQLLTKISRVLDESR